MGTPFLPVASFAVDFAVGSVAGDNGVQGLGAVAAFEALAMPLATLGQDLLRGVHDSSATGATFTRRGLDGGSVYHRSPGCLVTVQPRKSLVRRVLFRFFNEVSSISTKRLPRYSE